MGSGWGAKVVDSGREVAGGEFAFICSGRGKENSNVVLGVSIGRSDLGASALESFPCPSTSIPTIAAALMANANNDPRVLSFGLDPSLSVPVAVLGRESSVVERAESSSGVVREAARNSGMAGVLGVLGWIVIMLPGVLGLGVPATVGVLDRFDKALMVGVTARVGVPAIVGVPIAAVVGVPIIVPGVMGVPESGGRGNLDMEMRVVSSAEVVPRVESVPEPELTVWANEFCEAWCVIELDEGWMIELSVNLRGRGCSLCSTSGVTGSTPTIRNSADPDLL